tara:strand:- start:1615 stop:3072 length:1458 start_codon:yes stop_codon:yes gene_type:complete
LNNIQSLSFFIPELLIVGLIIATICFDFSSITRKLIYPLNLVGIIFVGLSLWSSFGTNEQIFMNLFIVDPFSHFFKILFVIAAFMIIVVSNVTKELDEVGHPEYYTLLMTVLLGLMLMVSSTNLIMIYIGIETASLASYVLAGMKRGDKTSNEASLKYVIFGSFASGIMLYGMSWLYGLSGSTDISIIHDSLFTLAEDNFMIYVSILMLLSGIGYKISMVPFHYWTPDVYEGSPTPVTAFFSIAPKAAGLGLFIRVIYSLFSETGSLADSSTILDVEWPFLIAVLATGTMTIGNLLAIQQNNVKRILAYSSIAHAGYMLMCGAILSANAINAILFYLVIYLFMNLGAFSFAIFISNKLNVENIEDYKGLGYKSPLMASIMVLFLVSLTGLPPTAGFIGKVYLFAALIESNSFYWLAVVGILNSVVSLFYYFNIARSMWLDEPNDDSKISPHFAISIIIIICSIPTMLFGIKWGILHDFIYENILF